jgi:L-threonylcarbamoyladenylate synthase
MLSIDLKKTPVEEVIHQTVAVLQAGGLVIFPTETTYGAGVDACNQAAVDKLLAYKARREGKPLSIAVTNQDMAAEYVEVNASAAKIYQRFLPGPVTVVSKSKGKVARGVESEFGTLGVRIPAYPLVLQVVEKLKKPITATSANGSGEKRPYSIQDIFDGLSEKQKSLIDLVLDAGELPHNPPSTVIDTTLSTPVVFRQGEVQVKADQKESSLISHSEQETKDIAKRVLLKYWNQVKEEGLVIGLNGSLGVGKTIFVKGVAEFLQISETITSPTYTYIEEYDFERHLVTGKLFHLDVWKIETEAEMERLEFPSLLGPRHIVIIEWASNIGEYLQKLQQDHSFPYVELTLTEKDGQREILLKE